MAARNFRFLFPNSNFRYIFTSNVKNIVQVRKFMSCRVPPDCFSKHLCGTGGNLDVNAIITSTLNNRPLTYQIRVRGLSSASQAYKELQDKVKFVLSKAPTQDQDKTDKQLVLLELLCQHKVGEITSADVTEASKNMTGDQLYELALALYSLKDEVGEESVEFWGPLFRMAALSGNNDAKYTYAQMLRSGTGVDPDTLEAAKLFRCLSDQGHAYAQFALAGMYYHGIGIDQDFRNAFDLYELSSKNGVDMASSMLGNMYMNGQGVEQNNKLALQYFQTGVQKGDPSAELSLAHCYSYGKGVTEDLEKAFEYHLSAAKKGHPIALYNTGTHYFAGKGVEANMEKAAEFFQMAADLGFDLAQMNLGNMYYNGFGVKKDWNKAKELYRKAAMTNKNAEALLKEVEEDERKLNEAKTEE